MAQEEKKPEEKKGPQRRPKAKKRMLQNEKSRLNNKAARTRLKTAVKEFHTALEAKDLEKSKAVLHEIYCLADKGVKKGVFSLNKASRTKAQLSGHLKKAAAAK